MYCKECGALVPENSRRCHICGADFIYAVLIEDTFVGGEYVHSASDRRESKMGYYNFMTWTQLPLTILVIGIMAIMFCTGINLYGIQMSSGIKSLDYACAGIYVATYLPFTIYLEYSLLNFKKNTGKIFAMFTVFQILVEGIIEAALYFVYDIQPDIKKIVVLDVARLMIWTVIAMLYLKSREGTFKQLSSKKKDRRNSREKNMVLYNLTAWSLYPILILVNLIVLGFYLISYIRYSEGELIEKLSMTNTYIYIKAGMTFVQLVMLTLIFIRLISKKIKVITMVIMNAVCAALEAGKIIYEVIFYDENTVKEILMSDIVLVIYAGVLMLLAIVGGIYVARRKTQLEGGKEEYRKVWYAY